MIQRNRKKSSSKSRELIVSENHMKVTPDLLEHALITGIRNRVGRLMEITLTDNKTSMISVSKEGRLLKVRLSKIFTLADNDVMSDLSDFISGRARSLPVKVRRFIDTQPAYKKPGKRPPVKTVTSGACYNLRIIARRLNKHYFDNRLNVRLTWGRRGRAPVRRVRFRKSWSIQYGSYDESLDLIRIHPALDSPRVPIEFIECVVYHEMLHKKLGVVKTINGRRRLHPPEFKKLEREYEGFEKAIDWEKKNFNKLLKGL
ncbi:hypothetical protein MNBD_NITROSPINAE04-28 [hydrothermal vent metagenome]|uniref:SprT-like domain-containing protein n=1 Tax=hydrothermal vent metagenome TaxID=652676 RepID=A0A3B1BHQ5_9ZZZZ